MYVSTSSTGLVEVEKQIFEFLEKLVNEKGASLISRNVRTLMLGSSYSF